MLPVETEQVSTATDDPDDFGARLRRFLAEALDEPELVLANFRRSGGGHSWETYAAETTVRGSGQPATRFAVKRQPSVGMLGTYDLRREIDILHTAAAAGVPVPRIIAAQEPTESERGFYIMNFVDGVVPTSADVMQTVPDARTRRALGLELAAILARLHAHPVEQIPAGLRDPLPDPDATGALAVARWQGIYQEAAAIRLPILDLAFAWLNHRAADVSGRLALIHNDLHIGNFIADGGRVAAVLDWETAEIGDPACDIAKFNLPTFRGGTDLASALVPLDDLLAEYERSAGWVPGAPALTFWTVLSLAKSATILLSSARHFATGAARDVRWGNMAFKMLNHLEWLVRLFEQGEWGQA